MKNLQDILNPFNYVVQRNWVQNPEHPDWDLFVSNEDYEALKLATREIPNIDIRQPGDGYYPPYIESLLLVDKRNWIGFKIPSAKAYFLSLYYHATVHKAENKYERELKYAFRDWIPPVVPEDPGVGYHGNY